MSFLTYQAINPSLVVHYPINNDNYIDFPYPCDSQTSCTPYLVNLSRGIYKFECWGSAGGYTEGYPALRQGGGYTAGIISLSFFSSFYFYIGGLGQCYGEGYLGGYNGGGGGYSSSGGGGATDIRIAFNNLNSRIMVAGGSGGADGYSYGGIGGGLLGGDASTYNSGMGLGGTQISGGYGNPTGSFGIGGNSLGVDGGGGGGGYYGGGHGYNGHAGGGGGSSFISGYSGCNAVVSSTDSSPSGQSIHYSGHMFSDSIIINGSSEFFAPNSILEVGHKDSGYIRITFLESNEIVLTPQHELYNCTISFHPFILVFLFLLVSHSLPYMYSSSITTSF